MPKRKSSANKYSAKNLDSADFIELVDIVRKSKKQVVSDAAFQEIISRIDVKIKQISYKFKIPGYSFHDVYQESLYALRYKAIKDYDPDRGYSDEPSPFEKFAILCIRRHLSTKLKASFQNKTKILNSCASLNQDRSDESEDSLYLADIVPNDDGTILDDIEGSEYFKSLMSKLLSKLSCFERDVFVLYINKYSYEQIADKLSDDNKKIKDIDVKSVDNALSRIKNKAKEIFDRYGQED